MTSNNRTAYKRNNSAYNWMTIPTGTREYLGEVAGALPVIASVLYFAAGLSMFSTERAAMASGVFSVLSLTAAIALLSGSLITWIGSLIKSLPDAVSIVGLSLLLSAAPQLFIVEFSEILLTGTWLEFIQSFSFLAEFVALAIFFVCLILMFFHVRINSKIGMLPAYCGVVAAVMLLIRTLSTYASLNASVGSTFNWDNASELSSQINWILRGVDTSSDYSGKMFSARVFERFAADILLASALPQLLRFKTFFEEYFRQMDLTLEIPGVRQMVESRRRRGKRNAADDEQYRYHAPGLGNGQEYDDFDDELSEPIIGVGKSHANLPRRSRPSSQARHAQPRPAAVRAEHSASYPQSVQPSESKRDNSTLNADIVRNKKTGAAIVKVRKSDSPASMLPDPNDESIWFQYKD